VPVPWGKPSERWERKGDAGVQVVQVVLAI
jgi:hypothetical protein